MSSRRTCGSFRGIWFWRKDRLVAGARRYGCQASAGCGYLSEAVMGPLGLAPLLERARADRVRVAPGEHRHRGLGLVAQPLLDRPAPVAHHGLLVAADGALRQLHDLVRELLGAGERPALRHHLVRKPDPLCLARVDGPARDDQLHRLRVADDEWEPHGHAVAADDVPAPLERTEDGV